MNWSKNLRKQLFIQLLSKHLLIIFIPFIILSPILFAEIIEMVLVKDQEIAQNMLSNAGKTIENRLNYIDDLSNTVLSSWRVRDFIGQASIIQYEDILISQEYYKFVSELRLMHYSNKEISEVAVYTPNFVVSSMGIMRTEDYFAGISQNRNNKVDFVFEDAVVLSANASINPLRVTVNQKDINTLAYIKQYINMQNLSDSGVIIFWNTDYLDKVLSPELQYQMVQMIYADPQGRILSSTKAMVLGEKADNKLQNPEDADYTHAMLSLPGNLFLYYKPGETLVGKRTLKLVTTVFFASAGVLLILSLTITYFRFRPVNTLIGHASDCLFEIKPSPYNEFQLIEQIIGKISSTTDAYRKRIHLHGKIKERLTIYRIMSCEKINDDEFSKDLFPGCFFLAETIDHRDREKLCRLEIGINEKYCKEVYCSGVFSSGLVIYLKGSQDECCENIRCILRCAGIEEDEMFFMVGPLIRLNEELEDGYRRAHDTLKRQMLWNNKGIHTYEPMSPKTEEYHFSVGQQLSISGAIVARDSEKLNDILNDLYKRQTGNGDMSRIFAECFYNELRIIYLEQIMKDKIGLTDEIGEINKESDDMHNIHMLADNLIKLAKDNTLKLEDNNLFLNIFTIVDEHILNPKLSLSFLKKRLDIPLYQISRIFKKEMLCGFQEYICLKRIEIAKEMLKNSEVGIKTIALSTGFSSATSFIRTFRQYEGKTPGEFRFESIM